MKRSGPGRALAHLEGAIADLAQTSLLRGRPPVRQPGDVSFCSNDYLGLAPVGVPQGSPGGAGASRLIDGDCDEHRALERGLADWLRLEDALVFTSGYAANVGTISALAKKGDLIVSDALNHASLIDGARLSGARIAITAHLRLEEVERALEQRTERRAWVVVESYYSMDGDIADVSRLRALCDRYDAALLVDEAHALGVFGPEGRGCCAEADVVPDVLLGAMGKSFGATGGFAAGSALLVQWLWNRARTFVFSTGISPALARKASASLTTISTDTGLREMLHARVERLRRGLEGLGVPSSGVGPIIPWRVGEAAEAMRLADALRTHGIHVVAIRPPTVPVGSSRLRFTVTAAHSNEDIDRVLRAVAIVLRSG